MPVDPEVARSIQERIHAAKFHSWMGLEVSSFDAGVAELKLALAEHHLNPGGIVHGGVIATMIDSAIGLAMRTQLPLGAQHVTLSLNVQYIAMSRTGSIVARGSALRTGGRAAQGEASVFDDDGRLLARGSATFMVVTDGAPA